MCRAARYFGLFARRPSLVFDLLLGVAPTAFIGKLLCQGPFVAARIVI
jgi:hypothetical protein